MPALKVGSRSVEVSPSHVVLEAERMFKLSASRRANRLEKAKAALAGGDRQGEAQKEAAIVLSQGISEI
ncbi:MAG: hypothetical protein JO255_17665 [Alphaproteobacteria bacterium]|nr:hypothetical protein [Alphaproteobacteria bacterium]